MRTAYATALKNGEGPALDGRPPRRELRIVQDESVAIAPPHRSFFPEGTRAMIYKPRRSAMTSGKARTQQWKLRFERRTAPFLEPLMGWTGGDDPMAAVELSFPSAEAAIAYARRQGIEFVVDRQEVARPQLVPHRAQRWRLEWVERTLGPEILHRAEWGVDPASRYADPADVLTDPELTDDQKRHVLHLWAVDAYLIELALARGESQGPSRLEDVMSALSDFNAQSKPAGAESARPEGQLDPEVPERANRYVRHSAPSETAVPVQT